jgi:hypothetical protein
MSKRKATRKLYPSEIKRRLDAMSARWPDGIQLFAASGTLLLIKTETLEVIDSFLISCDGGGAGTYRENSKEYLDLDV